MELRSVPREQVMQAWPDLLPFLHKVSAWDGFDPLTVAGRVLTQEYQLYVVVDADEPIGVFATQILYDAGIKGLKLVLVAGERLTDWFELEHLIHQWCKAEGINFLEGSGRPGMERILGAQGFRKTEVTLRKYL